MEYIQSLHPRAIDLGLERVATVYRRLDAPRPATLVIAVGGTNGKGSCVALLESILRHAGFKVGAYTSPHLLRFTERLRIDGRDSSDDQWCGALERVERRRGGDPLTYFEFATLAAVSILATARVDVALLEVGLGGRLDAVNAIPADAALISAIDIDHVDWLGPDRESIGREKAGLYRPGRLAVCADRDPPIGLRRRAERIGARYFQAGREFDRDVGPDTWTWRGPSRSLPGLPPPGLAGRFQIDNAAGCLMVLSGLGLLEQISPAQVGRGLRHARLRGRLQRVLRAPELIVDVGHNPSAARAIADWLTERPARGRTSVVLGMLKTKDAAGFVAPLAPLTDRWYLTSLPTAQSLTAKELAAALPAASQVHGFFDRVEHALERALRLSRPDDRVVVLGSFHTVAAALCHVHDPALAARDRGDVPV